MTNSTLNSSLPSGAAAYIGNYFNITSRYQLALPVSVFLIGYIFGPSIFSPLSEAYGRRIIISSTFITFMIFNLGCALAPNWPLLLLFRLLVGICASAPITVFCGVYADIFPGPVQRGKAMTLSLIVRPGMRYLYRLYNLLVTAALVHYVWTSPRTSYLRLRCSC